MLFSNVERIFKKEKKKWFEYSALSKASVVARGILTVMCPQLVFAEQLSEQCSFSSGLSWIFPPVESFHQSAFP